MALDSNLVVQSSAYGVEVQKALKATSWDLPKTTIDAEYGQINSYSKDNSVAISQSFAFPGLYLNQQKLAKANVKSSEWQHKSTQLEIATQVKQVYWQLAYLQSKQALLLYQDTLYSRVLNAATLRANAGETSKLEMITARSHSMEIKNELQQTGADISIENRRLQTLLNVDYLLLPADSLLYRSKAMAVSDSITLADNPTLGLMQEQVEVTKFEKRVEGSKLLPDFNIGYFSQTMQGTQEVDGVSRTFGQGDRFNGIQAGVAIPIWVTPHTAKIKAAKLKEQAANYNAQYYARSLANSYKSLIEEYQKYSKSVDFYEQQALPEANLIIDQATRSYRAGAMDYLDFILALNRAITIKENYLEALNSYNQTIISIDYITGKTF